MPAKQGTSKPESGIQSRCFKLQLDVSCVSDSDYELMYSVFDEGPHGDESLPGHQERDSAVPHEFSLE